MQNLLRMLLILGIAGSAMTALGSGAGWWFDEERRLMRLIRRALGGHVDGAIFARGRNAAAGFRVSTSRIVVMREGGAKAVLYPLRLLIGAELLVDDQVVGRTLRDEPRRPLDQIAAGARKVTLRLIFDDPTHPDFSLDLWIPQDQFRRQASTPTAAIVEGRAWLGRAEALLRKQPPPVFHRAAPETEPMFTEADPIDLDEPLDENEADGDPPVPPKQPSLF